ncbi:complex I NDUFA9 subunit family protein [Candidatus Jidaibacter acanthamoebae]|nr:complex I NDUFA9 subunit family protein [Candidatus Jidaibacter acanthamoeba]
MKKIGINDTITIFGGSGFIGSYIVKELAKTGAKIKIVSRNPEENNQLKVCGSVGQIAFVKGDIKSFKDIEKNVEGSTFVVNLVGILFESSKQKFNKLHVEAAKNIALSCSNNGIRRLIHFSALGVNRNHTSKYASTKLEGEKAVLQTFPNSVIIRPSVVFGREDNFINMFAKLVAVFPVIPLIGGGRTRLQPVYVVDVAEAVGRCLVKDNICGKVFELGGSKVYTLREIYELVFKLIGKKKPLVSIPFIFAKVMAAILSLLPRPLLTCDQVELLKTDNVIVKTKNSFEELGLTPTSMEAVLSEYIR